mmetsp:Transcript_5854/g.7195  ORF Transcript_5854/g.7195 Transcript_5854/m.7195 type:complete len:98 (-) Transcript_5854:419-712(-)
MKKSCCETDEDTLRVKNAHYRVRLVKCKTLSSKETFEHLKNNTVASKETFSLLQNIRQAYDIMLKTSMYKIMIAPGKKPRQFFFATFKQKNTPGRHS